jgi:acetyl esterase/lipase
MLSPSADSMSYYLNLTSSGVCPVPFLRWAWRAFLEMEPCDDATPNLQDDSTMENILKKDSNYDAWEKCKWREGTMRRLAEPLFELPQDLESVDAPKFIMSTNRADPLHDDGEEMAKALKKQKANVTYIHAKGSHHVGFLFDKEASKQRLEAWADALFGN